MNLYLAGVGTHYYLFDKMNLYLAGVAPWKEQGIYDKMIREYRPFILESFFYVNKYTESNIPNFADFMLDSGAFTFMQNKGNVSNFDDYTERYAEFINANHVNHFFELDIDNVIGYKNVLKLRAKLERLTGKQPIPVYHMSRGYKCFKDEAREYPYVAFGGIATATRQERKVEEAMFPMMIDTAHEYGAKIHALGYTPISGMKKYHFDSVDSTSWLSGNKFGRIWKFTGSTMVCLDFKTKRTDDKRPKMLATKNYCEWLKFQQYAKDNL